MLKSPLVQIGAFVCLAVTATIAQTTLPADLPTPLAYEYVLYKCDSVPQNNPMNPKYRAFIAMWQRLPLVVANTLGPHIVRNLG